MLFNSDVICNFSFSDPTPQMTDEVKIKWLPLSEDKFRLLSIGEELTMEGDQGYSERRSLWMEIYDTYE